MTIKVLGTGCSNCKVLFENAQQAVAELGLEATLIKEEDLMKIMTYNVLKLPALVLDEKVISSGKKLSVSEIKVLLAQ